VLPSEIGVLANAPKAPPPLSLNFHFAFKCATFDELSELAVVSRVFERLRLNAGHWLA
jgi:hypothetical protein